MALRVYREGVFPVFAAFTAIVSWQMGSAASAQQCNCAHCKPAIAAPLGSYNRAWQCGQVRAGHRAVMIHHCDWIGESDKLSPFMSTYLLSKLTEDMSTCHTPSILIEPTGQVMLDERRRQAVIEYLASNNLPGIADVVSVGVATRDRLRGDDASRVLENFGYQQTRTQSTQFNPFVGFGAPLVPGYGATNGGTSLPTLPGIFGR